MRILRLLRILGKSDDDSSEAMNDILAQVRIKPNHLFWLKGEFYSDKCVVFLLTGCNKHRDK